MEKGVRMSQQAVKLIAITKPVSNDFSLGADAEELIAYCARVSNPANQGNTDTAGRLLQYCIRKEHWSIFEMVNLVMEINTTRDIGRQILRHRSFSFQEFCLSGETEIYFAQPNKLKDGKYKPTRKMKLKDLWDKWENGAQPIGSQWNSEKSVRIPLRDRIKKMFIKCYDENTKQLTTAHIKEVFKTGVKDVFEITLEDGKKIKTTKEHKFLTQNGFDTLENITGLTMHNNRAVMTVENPIVGVNGIPLYQDKNWLEKMKSESIFEGGGIQWIINQTGYNYNTIRKWLSKYNLQYTKKEVSVICPVWNKGFFGYKTKPHSLETRRKMQRSALSRGQNHNWYRGGNSKKREPLDSIDVIEFRKKHANSCSSCGTKDGKIDLHHMIPVSVDPTKLHDVNNWQLLCRSCHIDHHKKNDYPGWQAMGAKAKREKGYTTKWQAIKSIEYIGKEETYDLEIDHPSHNYIANGIIVHNSQRYANVAELGTAVREARLQDNKNRQNSIETDDEEIQNTWFQKQQQIIHESKMAYKWAIENGIAKEQARSVLPEGNTMSRMYMSGSLRSWIHYTTLRMQQDTQKEHRLIATECWRILCREFPFLRTAILK
jgi:thymidylate synthase (FAD)